MGRVCDVMAILQSRLATATSRPPVRDIRDTVNPPRGFDQSAMLISYRVWDYDYNLGILESEFMMMSWYGNIFRVTGHVYCARINRWIDNVEAGDLRRYRVHYDVTVMCLCYECHLATPSWSGGVNQNDWHFYLEYHGPPSVTCSKFWPSTCCPILLTWVNFTPSMD